MKIGNLETTAEEITSHREGIRKRIIIGNGEVPHITQFARAIIPAGTTSEEHSHPDMFEIFIVEKGEGNVRINDIDHPLKKGSYVIIEPGEDHEFSSISELTLTYFGVKE